MQYRQAKHIQFFHKDELVWHKLGAISYKVGIKQLGDKRRYWALYLYKESTTGDPTVRRLDQIRCLGHFSCTNSQVRRRCYELGVTFFYINDLGVLDN